MIGNFIFSFVSFQKRFFYSEYALIWKEKSWFFKNCGVFLLLLLLQFSKNFGHSSWLSGSQFPDLVLNLGHDSESTGSQPLENQGTPSKSLLAATWTDLKGIMLREISQRKTNTIWNHLYVKPKRIQQTSEYASKEGPQI